jgi:hypothetical protein
MVLLVACATSALTGCSSQADPAEAVAEDFYASLSAADWSAACALLAPATRSELEQSAGTTCPQALAAEDLPEPGPVHSSERYGTAALTRLGTETVFLGRFGHRWKVMAAGCAPVPGRPYDCRLEGG